MKKYFFLFLFTALFFTSFSQANDAARIKEIVDDVMVNSPAYSNLRILCKDVGKRLSGSENYLKAVKLSEKLLKDAGADTVYLQECMVPHWERGAKESGEIILSKGKKIPLNLLALGNSAGTGVKGVQAKVIEVNNLDEIPGLASKIKGNIVFLNIKMNPEYINTFQAYGESARSRSRGPSLAAKYGAVGALVRTLSANINDVPNTGNSYFNDSFPVIPAVAISTRDAEFLSKELKEKNVASVKVTTYCKAFPDAVGYNVIGEIKGSEFPEEIITVGGHLDSWDIGEGAHDDGAGVMQSIEVIRVLKTLNLKPKRTVRAVLFANEENGLRGAYAYLNEAKAKKENHLFALESDAGGFTPRSFGFDTTPGRFKKIMVWQSLFVPYGVTEFLDNGGGADVDPLKSIGATVAGFNPDSQRYFDIHHNKNDVFENVSERELKLGAANMAALIYLVSKYGL
jgi:Zn-dependent M28 family amino/carboxypeptidase